MPRIVLGMENASNTLSVAGNVYEQSDVTHPIRKNVGVRMARGRPLVLDAGKYLYRFDVTTGSGKFDVVATQRDVQLAKKSGDTSVSDSNYVLRFTVTS